MESAGYEPRHLLKDEFGKGLELSLHVVASGKYLVVATIYGHNFSSVFSDSKDAAEAYCIYRKELNNLGGVRNACTNCEDDATNDGNSADNDTAKSKQLKREDKGLASKIRREFVKS